MPRGRASRAWCALPRLTEQREVLLVEQFRPPVQAHVIEFPAGLAGDIAGQEHEPLVEAARRELLEETGYEAREIHEVFTGPSSAGLTDECITFLVATGLHKVAAGGGDEHESIVVHAVPLAEAWDFLDGQDRRRRAGRLPRAHVLVSAGARAVGAVLYCSPSTHPLPPFASRNPSRPVAPLAAWVFRS